MEDKLSIARGKLKKYKQEHLLYFYDELSDEEKEILINQILRIDFDEIFDLYEKSKLDEPIFDVTPLDHIEKKLLSSEELDTYTKIGEDLIKQKKLAVVTMAGGQGTRLGYRAPKGTYKIDFEPGKKSLFEFMCDDLKMTNEKYGITLDWYIMTSQYNDKQTIEFFESNNYFDYPKEKIKFFLQDKLPIINLDGNLILEEPYLIKEASNGNGNVFNAMDTYGIVDDMQSKNIEWVFFGGIDNILLKNADPLFLGLTVAKNQSVASKSIFKKGALEKTAVYCRKNGKPNMLYYDKITLEISEQKDENGIFLYREANMLSHLMSIDAVRKISKLKLPYHRAFKKNAFVNDEGMKQVPDKPNTFKFENFIFDAFSNFDDMLLLRVNPNEEFAPIKDFTGPYNPDTAKEKYEKYWNLRK